MAGMAMVMTALFVASIWPDIKRYARMRAM
jgi:hypothetical protein